MQGDFSRETFDRGHHFTRVLMQQGRVLVDADWNEQAAISRHAIRTLLVDLIGPHAGPGGSCGFDLLTDAEVVSTLTDDLGRPLPAQRVHELENRLARGDFLIGQGRYYVGGMAAECDAWTTYGEQVGYPFDDDTTVEALAGAGSVLLYLDVWERHVSAVEDPGLVDVGLGGPDTTTRAQLVWQVRVIRGVKPEACQGVSTLSRGRLPLLVARAGRPEDPADLGGAAPGYRGTENRLYRVEIHRSGPAEPSADGAGATFAWSRENGSVLFAVARHDVVGDKVVLGLEGLDVEGRRGLAPGSWVQLVDDASTMRGAGSPILRVESLDVDEGTVVLTGTADDTGSSPDLHPVLRRWDHDASDPVMAEEGALLVREALGGEEGWIELEDGVSVRFPAPAPGQVANSYRTGDYWLVPARTATSDVIWAKEAVDGQEVPRPRQPDGIQHFFAPLAVASMSTEGVWTVETDCRRRFGPT